MSRAPVAPGANTTYHADQARPTAAGRFSHGGSTMHVSALRHRTLAILAAVGLAASGVVVTAPPAGATRCGEAGAFYRVSGTNTRMPFKDVPTFKDGPGGKIIVSRSYSGSVSYGVVAGAESEVGAVLAKAKVSISASLTKTNSTTTTHTYERKITAGKYGNVRYVSWGKRVAWTKKKERLDCTVATLAKGVIRFPATKEGWYYWETNS